LRQDEIDKQSISLIGSKLEAVTATPTPGNPKTPQNMDLKDQL